MGFGCVSHNLGEEIFLFCASRSACLYEHCGEFISSRIRVDDELVDSPRIVSLVISFCYRTNLGLSYRDVKPPFSMTYNI